MVGIPDLVKIAGAEEPEGCFLHQPLFLSGPQRKVQSFVQAYKGKYGDMPDSFAALGYDAAYLIADAINRAGSADPEAIRTALAETKSLTQ